MGRSETGLKRPTSAALPLDRTAHATQRHGSHPTGGCFCCNSYRDATARLTPVPGKGGVALAWPTTDAPSLARNRGGMSPSGSIAAAVIPGE
jgi:hypothetical protein